jgi:Do/DeqQ family serine protease
VKSYADVVEKVASGVVTVRSERVVRPSRTFPFGGDAPWELFGTPGAGQARPQIQRGLGSGVIVTKDGFVLTNHHVVDGADEIRVEAGRRTYRVKVVGSDPPTDLAVLKIEGGDLPALVLGDSDQVKIGDVVLAVGNPLGVGQTVTAGIISAKERSTGLGDGTFESFLQTDAPINQGNSGGGLLNTAGEVIGINSMIISPNGGNIGIGFAIPSNIARQVFEQLGKSGTIHRGKLGVSIQPVTPEIAASMGLDDAKGVLVNVVEPGSPAERAGVRQGDVITRVEGVEIADPNQLRNRIAAMQPGTEVTLTVIRDGREQQVRAKLAELGLSAERSTERASDGGVAPGRLGMSVVPLTPELAARLRLTKETEGLVVTDVEPIGAAADAGLREGDVIVQVGGQPAKNAAELTAALKRAGGRPALMLVNRQGRSFYTTIRPQ